MTVHLVTFATEDMRRSRELCARSALMKGGFGAIHASDEWHVRELRENYPGLFKGKGFGYWSWKPYLIDQLTGQGGFVRGVSEGDVVVYADAGVEFTAPVSHVISRMDQDIFLFGNNWQHAHWCKRDVVEVVWPVRWNLVGNQPHYPYPVPNGAIAFNPYDGGVSWDMFGKQAQASVIFFRVSDYSRRFVKEWLDWCLFEGGRLIDDSPSRLPNHPEFREHRHDQAILTTMAYREGLRLHYWPSMYNDGAFVYEKLPEYAGDDYPVLFHHHRRRNVDWEKVA